MSEPWHVVPIDDLIEHEGEGLDCVCGPELQLVTADDGTVRHLVVHNSLDGREDEE
jgi:hypothetical protein